MITNQMMKSLQLIRQPRTIMLRLKSQHCRASSPQPGYTLRRLTLRDKAAVVDFIGRYFRDEPLNLAVNLLQGPGSRCEELEEEAVSCLHHGVSIAAIDDRQNLAGVILNNIVRRKEAIYGKKSESYKNPKLRKVMQVLERLDREAGMWDLLPDECRAVLYINMGTIGSQWRGEGLTKVLCEASEELAKSAGAGAIRMDCTSAFTAMVARQLEFRKTYSIRYKDLDLPSPPKPPHVEVGVYVKQF